MRFSKPSVAKTFSDAATTYDAYASIQTHCFNKLMEMVAPSPATVLDIGCGTGRHTARLGALYPNASITAIDVSESMIAVATRRVVVPNVQFVVGDAETHLPPELVDLVIANASLHWFDNLPAALPHIVSRLTPRGQLVFSSFGPETFGELRASISAVLGREVILASGHFSTADPILKSLAGAGVSIRSRQEILRQRFDSVVDLLKNIRYSGTRGDGLPGTVWTPGLIRDIDGVYRSRFRDIWATYQVHFFECRR